MGVIPSSMSVPRLEARMTRIQYRGSEESEDIMPYSGTWEQTKKMRRVTAVHSTFWLKGTCGRIESVSVPLAAMSETSNTDFTVRRGDLWEDRKEWSDEIQKPDCQKRSTVSFENVCDDEESTHSRSWW
jgi:hypothetical protein